MYRPATLIFGAKKGGISSSRQPIVIVPNSLGTNRRMPAAFAAFASGKPLLRVGEVGETGVISPLTFTDEGGLSVPLAHGIHLTIHELSLTGSQY